VFLCERCGESETRAWPAGVAPVKPAARGGRAQACQTTANGFASKRQNAGWIAPHVRSHDGDLFFGSFRDDAKHRTRNLEIPGSLANASAPE
jgi:hypothetical protein